MKEKDLFPALKNHFKERGYVVHAEVPSFLRGVDFVAIKENEHIAVEMKIHFNNKVVRQAQINTIAFHKSFVAFPVRKAIIFNNGNVYWKLREGVRNRYGRCVERGIGILEVVGAHQIIFEALEAKKQKPRKLYDFSNFTESEEDEAGLPCQKGVSAGYYELEGVKKYVTEHPNAKWKEIYENVYNHYSSPASMAGAMKQWRGFSLPSFKKSLEKNG